MDSFFESSRGSKNFATSLWNRPYCHPMPSCEINLSASLQKGDSCFKSYGLQGTGKADVKTPSVDLTAPRLASSETSAGATHGKPFQGAGQSHGTFIQYTVLLGLA